MKLILSSLVCLSITTQTISQVLEKNEIDEFTGQKIRKTSYEVLVQNFKMNAFVSVTNINDSLYYMQLKLMTPSASVHAIDKDGIFFLKLIDNSVIELHNREYTISCTGCGAKGFMGSQGQGTMTTYYLRPDHIKKLKDINISKVRIYTTDGYHESEVKPNRAQIVRDLLALVDR